MSDKEDPRQYPPLPRTVEELMERKRKAHDERKAKRTKGQGPKTHPPAP